ncbi:c-type cytochrome [Aquabacterium sp. A7-Y]|uniref:di-heme oxidoreductase family protein n=1 Tax=Aquabacterium sp. A7-Y TaxID=1349605 RepID=UPI00223D3EAC|nr:di-heme oxidoredictase family protein [Aquabacterium sp. A7-Y]MCW7539216.1 c-type cytochrome [Aquabacterium sp. A7-Y]
MALCAGAPQAQRQDDDPLGVLTGGQTTVHADGRNAFSFPAANLADEERTRFAIGNSFFRRNWVEAPSSTSARDGLGPHFIARSCGGCHVQDGRGAPPDFRRGLSEPPVALLMRLSVPGRNEHGGPLPDPIYGDQLNNAAVQGVQPEARVAIRHTTVHGRFADGTRYTLQKPHYELRELAYGPTAEGLMLSPRIAPQVIGVGLLEAIADADILANVKEQAGAGGPIRGRANRVWDAPSQQFRLGRYGWKANVATLKHQTAAAFLGDIGITSSLFPDEACSQTQTDCRDAPRGAKGEGPEIDDHTLDNVVFYQATLAPPARRRADQAQVRRGQKLFQDAQCAVCHRPSYVTAQAPFPRLSSPALEGQKIWPYTDLLLHDMGEGLADGRPDFEADGRQWKTPPLWGVGLIREVNGHQRLLHDGRARGVLEAILWHGGEAQASRDKVLRMSREERAALVKFVESL